MNMYIYDTKRVLWPTNAPAKSIPIIPPIDSKGEISSAKTVQDAIQMITNDISSVVGHLPNYLNRDESTLRDVIDRFNELLKVLNEQPKNCAKKKDLKYEK